MSQSLVNRKSIVVFIAVVVGLLHFLTGPRYRGPCPIFVNGYMIEILLPFAMYLVLGIVEGPVQLTTLFLRKQTAFLFSNANTGYFYSGLAT